MQLAYIISLFESPDASDPKRNPIFLLKSKKLDASSRNNLAISVRIKLASKINYIKFIANTLVILGLIGTVIGFIIALSGVDGSVSSNPEEVSKMVTTLIQGMSVALYTIDQAILGSGCLFEEHNFHCSDISSEILSVTSDASDIHFRNTGCFF